MAGGKESPRQKMINMMYLVLTAMLALQVSNALLQKFQLLNNSLEKANVSANDNNNKTVEAIRKEIAKPGGEKYGDVLRKAGDVRKLTNDMNVYIEGLKEEIIKAGGGRDPETGVAKNLSEEEKVAHLMIGAGNTKDGKAYELKKKLDEFTAALSKYSAEGTKLASLAVDAKDDPIAKRNASISGKDYAQLNFEQTPVPAGLATLSQSQSEVRRLEGEVLDYLASQVGLKEIKFDEIFAVVIPDSRSVVAGQKYHAEVAIGAYSKSITPRISINGSALPVKDGKGTYEVTASGGDFDKNGQLKRSYRATVSYPAPDGSMKSVEKEETYTVLKPSVQIETASMPALYFKCANRLSTYSPGLGALYSPSFSGTGAEFIPGGSGKVTIVPNSAKASMNVVNDGITLQTFNFPVRRVPKPTIKLLGIDERRGAPASGLRTLNIGAIADESFKATNPEDAQFRVAEFEVNLARGSRKVGGGTFSGTANISNLAQQAQAGDRYVVVVKRVERKNFKGEVESVDVGEVIYTINLY
jgi:gliding motility-associated protein GldM